MLLFVSIEYYSIYSMSQYIQLSTDDKKKKKQSFLGSSLKYTQTPHKTIVIKVTELRNKSNDRKFSQTEAGKNGPKTKNSLQAARWEKIDGRF